MESDCWPLPFLLSNRVFEIFMSGDPVAHQRPRIGRNGRTYTPEKTVVYKEALAWQIKSLITQHKDQAGNLYGVQANFYRSTRQRIDVDNLLKTILDACTQAGVWRDDSQVREVLGRLDLAQGEPGVRFVIYKMALGNQKVAKSYQVKPCEKCNEPIKTYPSSDPRRYCSRECRRAAAQVTLECGNCKRPFNILRCLVRHTGGNPPTTYNRLFCCRDCSIDFNRKRIRIAGKESDKWICEKCGGRVSRKEYKICRGCSMKTRSDPTSNYWKLRHPE